MSSSVERIVVYCELESEPPAKLPDDPKEDWPKEGTISFRGVNFRYRDELPLVLKDVTFDVKAGERVGIVGRTGRSSAGRCAVASLTNCCGQARVRRPS